MKARHRREGKSSRPASTEPEFQHASQHASLESLLADHVLDEERAAATADWFPSRRGNSPRAS